MVLLLNGFVLGWSVAWPPGPVNAEMIRRGVLRKERGGGFWSTWQVGLGACIGDFIWALCVSLGAGVLLNSIVVRRTLAVVSLVLLFVLAWIFARSGWRIYRSRRAAEPAPPADWRKRGGLWLGLLFALSSPWSIGFWFAVIGSQTTQISGLQRSLALAASVVLGALTWTLVLCGALKYGASIFSRPGWQIMTEALTCLVMLFFAMRLVLHFP